VLNWWYFSPEFSLFVGDVSEDLDDYSLFNIFASKYLSCKSANSKNCSWSYPDFSINWCYLLITSCSYLYCICCSVRWGTVDCVYIFSSRKEEISVSVEWVLMNNGVMLYILRGFLCYSQWVVLCDEFPTHWWSGCTP